MNPRQLNIICDFILFILLFGISFSIYFYYKEFDKDIMILKRIFESWKFKPIHLIQESSSKTCKQIGMDDIVKYYWPGAVSGCHCNQSLDSTKCTPEQEKNGCNIINGINPITFNKWKGSYICSSSIKAKTYFELSKVKESDNCPSKHKKCGKIDTLNNILCVQESENCPLNYYEFRIDGKNVRIETANNNPNGKIYTNFKVVEGSLCINHSQKEFSEWDYKLIKNHNFYKKCKTIISDDKQNYYNDTHFDRLDSISKKHFYDQNEIAKSIISLPGYPKVFNSHVNLYGSTYIGWKKECMKKEFFSYMNNNTDSELNEVFKTTQEYNNYLYICGGFLITLFVFGIVLLKYYMIIVGSYKIDIGNKAFFIIVFFYLLITIINGFLYYIADINLEVIKSLKQTSDFFELVGNKNCSDDLTNATLKFLYNNYLSYPNRYFNIKLLSCFSILLSLFMIVFIYFSKTSLDMKRNLKKKTFKFE